ncbi:MAG: hypothetical protein HQL26_05675 [Candidatus Omnitrophica bacterium]|nr:hypothetical protein [Candidatus Omnitrophota bacterium]
MKKIISLIVLVTFAFSMVIPPSFAQPLTAVGLMPMPGTPVVLSPVFAPAHLKGMVIDPNNPFKFDFIIHRGDEELSPDQKQMEYAKLIKYFLAALAVPDTDQWVNLSPYEKNRIIPDSFGKTEMGRDLLAQDYLLKQISATLVNPDGELGKQFWSKVYDQASKQFKTSDIPTDIFNKIWITPDKAVLYEKGDTVYVVENHLKVILEEDYFAEKENHLSSPVSPLSSLIKKILLPAIEKEVNEGKNFAPLRQVYSGMLLATWYKIALKESILGKVYANQGKVKGVDQDPKKNQEIYNQYVESFKKGVFNMIKEEYDPQNQQIIPRKYFSGGTESYARLASQGATHGYSAGTGFERQKNNPATEEHVVQGDGAMLDHATGNFINLPGPTKKLPVSSAVFSDEQIPQESQSRYGRPLTLIGYANSLPGLEISSNAIPIKVDFKNEPGLELPINISDSAMINSAKNKLTPDPIILNFWLENTEKKLNEGQYTRGLWAELDDLKIDQEKFKALKEFYEMAKKFTIGDKFSVLLTSKPITGTNKRINKIVEIICQWADDTTERFRNDHLARYNFTRQFIALVGNPDDIINVTPTPFQRFTNMFRSYLTKTTQTLMLHGAFLTLYVNSNEFFKIRPTDARPNNQPTPVVTLKELDRAMLLGIYEPFGPGYSINIETKSNINYVTITVPDEGDQKGFTAQGPVDFNDPQITKLLQELIGTLHLLSDGHVAIAVTPDEDYSEYTTWAIKEGNNILRQLGKILQNSQASRPTVQPTDNAALTKTPYGGIDMARSNLNLQIKRDGNGVPLPMSQQNLDSIKIEGLVPVILEIRPAAGVPLFKP